MSPTLNTEGLQVPRRVLAALRGRRVAVVGDLILDRYMWGDTTRISPEAPVPVVLLERDTAVPGGAGNVAANVVGLGGRAALFGLTGDDAEGGSLRELCASQGVETGGVVQRADRPTTIKYRVLARNKHVVRIDREVVQPADKRTERAILAALERDEAWDAVAISDYGKGCVTPALVQGIGDLCRARRKPWCVDPKNPRLHYTGADVLKPNLAELELLARLPARTPAQMLAAAGRVLRSQGCRHVLVTQGAEGMSMFGPGGREFWIASTVRAVADVTGAGDTVLASLALSLAGGLGLRPAVLLAVEAAGHVVQLPGTAVATLARQD